MSTQQNDVLGAWVAALQKLPKPKKVTDRASNQPQESLTKALCACKKFVDVASLTIRNSGVTHFVDNVCKDCAHKKDFAEQGVVICVRCRTVVMHLPPMKDKAGFEIRKGGVYHTEACPSCKPGLSCAVVIEKILYDRRKGISH